MDNCCNIISALAVGIYKWLHTWRIYTYFDNNRYYCCADTDHSGPEIIVEIII